jgi:hypothetical protein
VATKKTLEKRTISANNYIAGMVALCIFSVVILGFAANSLGRQAILYTKVIAGKQQAKWDLDTKVKNAQQLVQNYSNLGSKRTVLEDTLPITPDFPQIVTIADSMAAASGVKVKEVSPPLASFTPTGLTQTASTPSDGAQEFEFGVDITGSYARIQDFLQNIELSVRPMQVVSADFKGADGALQVSLKIKTFYQEAVSLDDKTKVVK